MRTGLDNVHCLLRILGHYDLEAGRTQRRDHRFAYEWIVFHE